MAGIRTRGFLEDQLNRHRRRFLAGVGEPQALQGLPEPLPQDPVLQSSLDGGMAHHLAAGVQGETDVYFPGQPGPLLELLLIEFLPGSQSRRQGGVHRALLQPAGGLQHLHGKLGAGFRP